MPSSATARPAGGVVPARDGADPGGGSADEEAEAARYSVFTAREKRAMAALVALASWASNTSAFILLPALPRLAAAFAVSVDRVNLLLTAYMAVATVAPTLAGDAADVLGRRPAYVVTLGLFLAANVGLGLARSYAALLGLRVLQAMGQSGIIVIGYGVVTDIAAPAERGSFMSAVSFAITIAPSFGPILGGALSYGAGWAWVFWFLALATAPCLALIVCFLPETCRNIVGDGSVQPPRHLRLPLSGVRGPGAGGGKRRRVRGDAGGGAAAAAAAAAAPPPRRMPNPLRSLGILLRKDNAVVVAASGLMYTIYACVIATLSTLCIEIYALNQWQAGLVYLPFGLGGTASTFLSGPLLDWAYRRARRRRGLAPDGARDWDPDDFPVEKARIGVMWIPTVLLSLFVAAYGWVLQRRLHLALPLSFQLVLGMALQFNFSCFNTLIADINHRSPSAANASTAVVRCGLAAIAVAYMENMFDAVGVGWTFTALASLGSIILLALYVEYRWGTGWRRQHLTQQSI